MFYIAPLQYFLESPCILDLSLSTSLVRKIGMDENKEEKGKESQREGMEMRKEDPSGLNLAIRE